MTRDTFLVPDYYPSFHCKGGSCRHTCCSGWSVTLTEDEYFRLESLDLEKSLKEKIEAYVAPLPNPTKDRYARINFTYEGECPLLSLRRLCRLQLKEGENALPSVCRYYPRGPREGSRPECSVSDSCEALVELLFSSEKPLAFRKEELTFDFDVPKEERTEKEIELQKEAFRLLSRTENSPLLNAKDVARHLGSDLSFSPAYEEAVLSLLPLSFTRSASLAPYLGKGSGFDPRKAEQKLSQVDPSFPNHFARLLVNHLFFTGFPALEGVPSPSLSGLVLYFLVRFYEDLSYPQDFPTFDRYVDYTADFFRMAEHSNFPEVLLSVLSRAEQETGETLLPTEK